LLLDGGSMFGVVPRVVWTRAIEPDERNRIALAHNCLLLERADEEAGAPSGGGESARALGPERILIETGTGDKLDPKMSEIFGLEDRTVETAVREAGLDPRQIDAVVVSHLHFDHAGGLTRRCRAGEEPDWIAPDNAKPIAHDRVKVTFPNAAVHVQRREWQDATANDAVMTRTYYRDHLDPIESRLVLADSPDPFPRGSVPHRDALPEGSFADRRTQILPGVFVFLVPGHTWGQQAVLFTDPAGRTVVFTPDVMPSVHHVGSAYSLAYDVEPYTTMLTKHWFLEQAVEDDWLLVLDHEPDQPCQRVVRSDRGWYRLEVAEGV